jgi:hypothetical protein
MKRALALAAVFAAVVTLSAKTVSAPTAVQPDRVWFAPAPGSLDYIDLFNRPQEWPRARALTTVFKFYQQHTQTPAAAIVGPNTYEALAHAGVFRTLKSWGIKTAIEVGSVKEFYCTPDPSGMNTAIANTVASINAVRAAGGAVYYLAMDEPFVSGRSKVCNGPALEPTADRVATYVAGVHAAFPMVKIGLIEAYPFSSEAAIENIVQLLQARNATPAFVHMDTDWRLSGADAFKSDMSKLQAFCASKNIPFGHIIVGASGESDPLYSVDAYGVTELIAETYRTWEHMPDQLIVQSWAQTSTGLFITPSNLPEDRSYTHTNTLWTVWRRLRGATGASTGTAVPRR